MDEKLQDYIDRAVADYLHDSGGGMVTGWHFIADLIDGDGDQSWLFATAHDQRQTVTMGLLEWARGVAVYEQQAYLDELGDD